MIPIKVEQLTKDYNNNKGVFDVSFEIQRGEVFGFLGPNGAGKTTTIRHLLGFSKPDKGQTFIEDLNCWKNSEKIQKQIGYIPGEISLPHDMTGMQLIKLLAKMRSLKDLTKANELIQMFGLDPSGNIKRMSKGMKQKIGIVVAFMHDPEILILDEPTSGLDPLMQNTFVNLIEQVKSEGKTVLMSSHIFEEVEKTCDRIAIIKQGKIVSEIDANTLKHTKQKVYKIEFLNNDDYQKMISENFEIIDKHQEKNQIKVVVNDEYINEFLLILTKYKVKFLSEEKHTLGDYFMNFYE